jgi:hypothetical protein
MLSNEGINNNELRRESKLTGEKEAASRGKARKSTDITKTPIRGQAPATTPNKKKTGKREQGMAKKSRQGRKKGLLEFFGGSPRVKAPSTDGTPIETLKNRREKTGPDNDPTKKRDSSGQNKAIRRKKPRSDDEDLELQVDLEQMEKTLLKVKGMKSSTRKTKKEKETRKASTPNTGGKKKATFTETVGNNTVEEQKIDYKTCVVGFVVQVDKGKDTKGGFDKKIMEGLAFMQTYIDKNTSFHAI